MKFSTVRFTAPVEVYKNDRSTGMLTIDEQAMRLRCDSLEILDSMPTMLICRRTDPDGTKQVKCVPVSKIESADPIVDAPAQVRKAG